MLSVSGCASDQSSSKPYSPEESKQAVAAKAETKTAQTVNGRATWYGPGLYGNKTTSGDVLEKGTMTAAHSSLPMGT